ncbi:MAG: hypothetical protein ACLUD2_17685 [Clostridium sp.]
MDLTYDKKKWIGIVLLLVFAILSFSAGANMHQAPEHHKATIAALDEKKGTVLELTVAATATSALITLIPGDVGTPIAEKVADLSGYLLIVLVCGISGKVSGDADCLRSVLGCSFRRRASCLLEI